MKNEPIYSLVKMCSDEEDFTDLLEKVKVEGGYIYRSTICSEGHNYISTVFVPDIDLTRYQAHLRDAYNAGYKDGVKDAQLKDIKQD